MLDPKIEEALSNGIKDTMWMCFWKGEQKANLEELEDSCKDDNAEERRTARASHLHRLEKS